MDQILVLFTVFEVLLLTCKLVWILNSHLLQYLSMTVQAYASTFLPLFRLEAIVNKNCSFPKALNGRSWTTLYQLQTNHHNSSCTDNHCICLCVVHSEGVLNNPMASPERFKLQKLLLAQHHKIFLTGRPPDSETGFQSSLIVKLVLSPWN